MTMQERAFQTVEELTSLVPPQIMLIVRPFLNQFQPSFEKMDEDEIIKVLDMIQTKIDYVRNGADNEN